MTKNVIKVKTVKTVPVGIESVTLQRDGMYACVYVQIKGRRHLIIKTMYDNWYFDCVTSDGIREELKRSKAKDELKKLGWRGYKKKAV